MESMKFCSDTKIRVNIDTTQCQTRIRIFKKVAITSHSNCVMNNLNWWDLDHSEV